MSSRSASRSAAIIVDADTDQILGAAVLSRRCPGVDQHPWPSRCVTASPPPKLRDSIYTHPSSTEAFNDVIGAVIHTDDPLDA